MFNLPEHNIHLSATADNKQQAIEMAANALVQGGYVAAGYLQGMLAREQQTSTFLGNGIAIPHGTLETRDMVKKTGVQIFQFPNGIEWGEGNTAYIVIGIAARSDEHLALLRQLTHVLGDDDTAASLVTLQDKAEFRAILMGEKKEPALQLDFITLDVETNSTLTLTAINAGKLEAKSAVDPRFVSQVIADQGLVIGNGIVLNDNAQGNQFNAVAFSRAKQAFNNANGDAVQAVITVAAVDDQLNSVLALLLTAETQTALLQASSAEQIIALLDGKSVEADNTQSTTSAVQQVVGTFTVRNEHGLHARPGALLVSTVKPFAAKVTVENLDRPTAAVNAKSLMKLVALGVVAGHRLRFTAAGDDAKAAIEAIGKAIADGLGEGAGITPQQADSIEEVTSAVATASTTPATDAVNSDGQIEGTFSLKNEHGLHARPCALLVQEAKKFQSAITVENLDRQSAAVSAKSMMKVVALGALKGHQLRFVAKGEDAQRAIDAIGAAIAAGLGE
ncbi:fused PTS fructose transporter subunit IIA/HPr protein [Testudinibacter aquarius]|uniref:Multiphosphoryl transfer protein n=1 Tax=Testudinibacter aquarius TaxID=1524974 RepID=A0A4R3Y0I6_9PAST|nr:fused PTS fructose transporter subunit IIA/HPr protein [Testudinibacter aquarius]KAE9526442.1 bifunctional PTS fructose transporter subunit IIA/HPr protein [Testudinibacter aquarius]TCV83684.1 phosphocarrier protein HPr /PTS system D-fructose-specific IIA component (F1P-forming) (Frc family) [Testudinibacter aquarius]TNG93199.1 HPr family phosphocarrier protein [Testudinibacter aquarius]